jgi:PhnB protein
MFVESAQASIDFLVTAFDGEEKGRTLEPDNRIANAQVRIGTTTLMISEATERFPPMPTAFYLYIEDADAAMEQALAIGASLEMEVADMPYEDRQRGVVDPFGNIWWISQRLVDRPYD